MRYGIGLTGSVFDMATGIRNPDFVINIIARTDHDLGNPKVVDDIIVKNQASGGPWSHAPMACERVFRRFVREYRIDQPLRTMKRIPSPLNPRWVDSIDDIQWVAVRSTEGEDALVIRD